MWLPVNNRTTTGLKCIHSSIIYDYSFTSQVCQCNGNYAGYDCSRCKFGHYGPDCSQSQVLPRPPVATYTDSDWAAFIDTIVQSRTFDSGYVAVLEEAVPGTTNLKMTNISLYKLFVWLHHFAAKDSATPGNVTKYVVSIHCICMQ